jgi:prophage regulatory protein
MREAPSDIDRILRRPELLRVTGLSAATIFRLIREKKFPAPVAISQNSKGWFVSAVKAWQESLKPSEAMPDEEAEEQPTAAQRKERSRRRGRTSGDARR